MIDTVNFDKIISSSHFILKNAIFGCDDSFHSIDTSTNDYELGIEFSYPDLEQVLSKTEIVSFFNGDAFIEIPYKILVYYADEIVQEDYSPHCEAQFLGKLILSNTLVHKDINEENIEKVLKEFTNIYISAAHHSNNVIWKRIFPVFKSFIQDSNFPIPPEEISITEV